VLGKLHLNSNLLLKLLSYLVANILVTVTFIF